MTILKFYYTTDDGGEFSYLMSYNLASQEKKKVLEKSWDIAGSGFTSEGTYMVVYVNEDGKNAIEVLDTKTMKPIDLPDYEDKSITSVGFSDDENGCVCMWVVLMHHQTYILIIWKLKSSINY